MPESGVDDEEETMASPVPQVLAQGRARVRPRSHPALALLLLALILAAAPRQAGAKSQPRSAGVMMYDAVIERPIGAVETLVGAAVTLVAYPLALGSGRTHHVLERCIQAPARYTFKRPLGDFSQRPENDCGALGLGWGTMRASLAIVERPLAFIFGRSPLSPEVPKPQDELEI